MEAEKILEGLKKLREPFPQECINLLPKPYRKDSEKGHCKECGGYHGLPAVHLAYVGHAALTDRLLSVDPTWNWEPMAYGADGLPKIDDKGGMWIRLTVCGITRPGYGHATGSSGDTIKELIGDALRNAAMRFGAALEFWHKGKLPPIDEQQDCDPEETISAEQLANLEAIMQEINQDLSRFCTYYQIENLEDLPISKYEHALKSLEKKRSS